MDDSCTNCVRCVDSLPRKHEVGWKVREGFYGKREKKGLHYCIRREWGEKCKTASTAPTHEHRTHDEFTALCTHNWFFCLAVSHTCLCLLWILAVHVFLPLLMGSWTGTLMDTEWERWSRAVKGCGKERQILWRCVCVPLSAKTPLWGGQTIYMHPKHQTSSFRIRTTSADYGLKRKSPSLRFSVPDGHEWLDPSAAHRTMNWCPEFEFTSGQLYLVTAHTESSILHIQLSLLLQFRYCPLITSP